ncbi:MAG: zinc-binding dehydrogenase [Proteobacteria bacterium]|jgi:NADPH:quinone reductase-like Zn-dependent oxidoreductase|nr:zinc-binding dehydrogenase [Pseudomonadota bacterium]
MKAIRIEEHGGPEVLKTVDIDEPQCGHHEVMVEVTHVGLNHLDVWVRKGVEGHPFPLPLISGSDVVGIRTDTGEPTALFPAQSCLVCDACATGRHDLCRKYLIRGEGFDGGCCERIAVPSWQLLPCPIAPEQAAAIPLSLLTAWHMLVTRARVAPGDLVLVQAGASGVGSLAIQVARLCGARVVATASTEAKRSLCLDLGAEEAWAYEEASSELRRWTKRKGIDIVVEHVGAATWKDSLRALRWGGTLVTCGATAGHKVELDLRVLFFKQLSLLGSTMGSLGEMRQAWQAVTDGRIVPVVDRVLPMSELGRAHELLETRKVGGKVVVHQDLSK